MDQKQIIREMSDEIGLKPCKLLDRWGDGLGALKNTRQAYHKWINGESKPNPKTLRHALTVFQPGSWEYRLADDLLRAGGVGDGKSD
jgi:hypothetical protein